MYFIRTTTMKLLRIVAGLGVHPDADPRVAGVTQSHAGLIAETVQGALIAFAPGVGFVQFVWRQFIDRRTPGQTRRESFLALPRKQLLPPGKRNNAAVFIVRGAPKGHEYLGRVRL